MKLIACCILFIGTLMIHARVYGVSFNATWAVILPRKDLQVPASRQGRTARRHTAVYRVSSYSTFCVRRENYITHVKKSFRAIDCITTRFIIFLFFCFRDFYLFLYVDHRTRIQARNVNVTVFQASCIIVLFTQTNGLFGL